MTLGAPVPYRCLGGLTRAVVDDGVEGVVGGVGEVHTRVSPVLTLLNHGQSRRLCDESSWRITVG